MDVAYVVVTAVTIAANAAIAAADLARAGFVLANSAEVGVPQPWLPRLAALKAAGAAGLAVGLLGTDATYPAGAVGVAAAAGLVLFYAGALAAHTRARVFYNLAFPGGYFALAVASLVLALAR
ncbi:DoxX family protein [Actinacidiphila bryophytorum]|uniref:DoxX-like protein n=1 Tax=Actinacidiphila bryophytorum TaxID=1436133 RepID=A0A9W4E4N5_9ACTN|nr:DoxX family protein [Actinacidiphila bryophytorum]MBM9438933.1 DoxX family protein [Actinacidiphila bryophytorum]MBN6547345.1 DoxX family protein [Actinacidiphila bryophytorum]CAG7616259.1 DoxX-like protein [Actinacidiphila bryophytorum]